VTLPGHDLEIYEVQFSIVNLFLGFRFAAEAHRNLFFSAAFPQEPPPPPLQAEPNKQGAGAMETGVFSPFHRPEAGVNVRK